MAADVRTKASARRFLASAGTRIHVSRHSAHSLALLPSVGGRDRWEGERCTTMNHLRTDTAPLELAPPRCDYLCLKPYVMIKIKKSISEQVEREERHRWPENSSRLLLVIVD